MTVLVCVWLLALGVSLGACGWVWRQGDIGVPVRWTGVAVIPSVVVVAEWGLRAGLSLPGAFLSHWPFAFGSLAMGVPIVGSFLDAPIRTLGWRLELIRQAHVVTWASGSVLAVSMVLDA